MKLLIVTQAVDKNDPVLGFFHRWIEEFSRNFEAIEVVCLIEGEHTLPSNVRVRSLGKPVQGRPASGWEKLPSRFTYAFRFWNLIWKLRHEYDAVFVHMNPEYVIFGGPLWSLLRKKVGFWYTHKAVNLRLRLAAMFADVIFTASSESFRLANPKVKVMGHGIDTESFVSVRRDVTALNVFTVGRISKSKRLLEMVRVLDVIADRGIPFTFAIVGVPATPEDATYEHEIREKLAKRPFAPCVKFIGPVPHRELATALDGASVFVNMSETGSMDKAVLEALAAGIPVVTTNEAFRAEFPESFVASTDVEHIADAILEARKRSTDALRDAVRARHGLTALIARIRESYAV